MRANGTMKPSPMRKVVLVCEQFHVPGGLITDDLLTTKFSTVAKIVSTDGYILATRPHFARGCPRV